MIKFSGPEILKGQFTFSSAEFEYTSNFGFTLASVEQLECWIAVNLVDALDRKDLVNKAKCLLMQIPNHLIQNKKIIMIPYILAG
jgi:hypothetical protein